MVDIEQQGGYMQGNANADEAEADRDTQKVLEQAVCQLLSA